MDVLSLLCGMLKKKTDPDVLARGPVLLCSLECACSATAFSCGSTGIGRSGFGWDVAVFLELKTVCYQFVTTRTPQTYFGRRSGVELIQGCGKGVR